MQNASVAANRESRSRRGRGMAALADLLACPACGSRDISSTRQRETLTCMRCAAQFPVFHHGRNQIPWMFGEPLNTRLEWKARFHGFLHENSLELERLRRARNTDTISKTGRKRIQGLLQAREKHRNQVGQLLAAYQLDGIEWPADATSLLHGKLPSSQGLSSYVSSVFRDWAWNNGENEILIATVERVMGAAQRAHVGAVLTLGAGACRLPYDVHRRYAPDFSVALDINPLLLQVASEVTQGNTVPLCEFPIAPLNADSFAVLHECSAPESLEIGDFHFVLADATNPPFVAGSFDTVITPWLIDVIPEDLRTFIPKVNRCLAQDGIWVNTGSLVFLHKDEAWRYSQQEVLELLECSGFEVLAAERETIPHLQSPHSACVRGENAFSFAARKVQDSKVDPAPPYLPEWILDPSVAVPASTEMAISSSNHLLKAQVMSHVDGKRTIRQIARIVARQYGFGKSETIQAVRRIFIDHWERTGAGDDGVEP